MEKQDFDRYLEDLREIKQILREKEGYPVVEYWAFLLWGVVVLIGAFIAWWCSSIGWSEHQIFWGLWLPLMVVASVGEFVAWVRQSRRLDVVLFTPGMLKVIVASIGIFVVLLAMSFSLLDSGRDVPGIYVLLGSVPLFMYGVMSYMELFFPGAVLLFVGFFMWIGGWKDDWLYFVAAGMISVAYFISGYLFWFWDREYSKDALHKV
ncbi:hypothetical protein WKV44_01405 [Spirochaetia bacterium 38H-sp]|uniref:Uncharacterized protein n=1 Tax=Rarispira pelagica TaxID=3141764 RepID=A0ABU9U9N4_9SPIR